jgi:hypothetical protein
MMHIRMVLRARNSLKSGALDIYTIRSQVAEYLKAFADEMTV